MANPSPEPTAIWAVRSAVAVHVASRRGRSNFRHASHRSHPACLPLLCLLLISVTVTSGCATCGRSSEQASEKKGGNIWSDRSFWGWLLDAYGTH